MMTARDDFDPLAPQREAAFFYGLFLRGHPVENVREDIDVPRIMLDKWLRAPDFEMTFRESLQRVYSYRKQVLAIFDGLVLNEQNRPRIQQKPLCGSPFTNRRHHETGVRHPSRLSVRPARCAHGLPDRHARACAPAPSGEKTACCAWRLVRASGTDCGLGQDVFCLLRIGGRLTIIE